VFHKTTIKVVELVKNIPRLIKPETHPTLGLWYVLEGGMGFINWEGKN
jgi:hypothetical protein